MTTMHVNSRKLQLPPLADRLERLRAIANLPHQQWFELLEMPWLDYQAFKMGHREMPEAVLEKIAAHFGFRAENLVDGRVDFQDLALRTEAGHDDLPEHYSRAAFGRRRTSITSVEFLERNFGWRLRLDSVRHLEVPESTLLDPFAPISVKFISDLCLYLARRRFKGSDFFEMGAYMYEGNKDSAVGRLFAEMPSLQELYGSFFGESMRIFEQNCSYEITGMDREGLVLEIATNPDVAAELGVRHVGNVHLCSLKAGMISCIPQYLGLPRAKVAETCCVHHGDPVCRFEVEFPQSRFTPRA